MVMQPVERNPIFTNLLVNSPSPYLRQHAHNPVFWYPWGKDALDRAKAENKPIFLSIGYSSCYWCHVMEREVFENVSIAALMNQSFVNIKVDREEHPEIDDIYMIARQLLKQEGGWPNNVFLTPALEPFYAGGTYAADESTNRPAFPRLLEWINHTWETNRDEALSVAKKLTQDMRAYLLYRAPKQPDKADIAQESEKLFNLYTRYYDARAGGFFQAPKFPHECYLQFLLGYYEATGKTPALDMVTHSLHKMAAGGLQDHVGCGFHRYAIDKEWYVPHFEKMLYNQAQLARLYTDAARITGNPYFADLAKSILDFVGGPLTSVGGAFYVAIDAESDGIEGAHYAWSAKELDALLTPDDLTFLTTFYAMADIPQFPGHKHVDGQVLIARKPLDLAARERNIPYAQLAAVSAGLMNKMLEIRNKRPAPIIDDKILVGWNGLMIDAFAHAGRIFNRPSYTARAREALDFILERAVDNNGNLKRVYAGGHAYLEATLDDYAFLIKGIISLWRATPDVELLGAAKSLAVRVEELFSDNGQGYFYTQSSERTLLRLKSGDDSAIPNSNAVYLHNLIDLYDITQDSAYLVRAKILAGFFLNGNEKISVEWATMMHAAMRLNPSPSKGMATNNPAIAASDDIVTVSATLSPADPAPGAICEVIITLNIKDGWHINANRIDQPFLIATQIDVQGEGVEVLDITYPEAANYKGKIVISASVRLLDGKRLPIKIMARFQPCQGASCYVVEDRVVLL